MMLMMMMLLVLLHETLSTSDLIGGALIIVGCLYNELDLVEIAKKNLTPDQQRLLLQEEFDP